MSVGEVKLNGSTSRHPKSVVGKDCNGNQIVKNENGHAGE